MLNLKNLTKLVPSNNQALPEMNVFAARSFWLTSFAAATMVANTLGIDLLSVAQEVGLGSTESEIIASGEQVVSAWQQLAPILGGSWAYLERRAPNFRLVLPWAKREGLKA